MPDDVNKKNVKTQSNQPGQVASSTPHGSATPHSSGSLPRDDEQKALDELARKLETWKAQVGSDGSVDSSSNVEPQQDSGAHRPLDVRQNTSVQSDPSSQSFDSANVVSEQLVSSSGSRDDPSFTSKSRGEQLEKEKEGIEKIQVGKPRRSVSQSEGQASMPRRSVAQAGISVTPEDLAPEEVKDDVAVKKFEEDILQASAVKSETYPKDIKKLLELAKERNASDLHVTVGYPPMLRIDGKLVSVGVEVVTPEVVENLIFPALAESKRDLLEVNREVDVAYELEDVARFRVNVYHEKGRLAAAFRLIPSRIKTLEELGLPKILRKFTKINQGFVLITGPTGHGKTTTLASILQEINKTYDKHIITIEDPIEYVYPRARALISQREMHEDTHSWEIALRSAMREDPDVVLVGEMRDYETISSAITLAETGHLVFATLHTNSASQTIDRIIDTFPDNQQKQVKSQLASIIEGVVSQRLVPVRTGGRRPACEIMLSTPAVKNLIREGKVYQIDNVIKTSLDVGMTSMENSLVQLVREGLISVEQAEEYAMDPEEVIRLLR